MPLITRIADSLKTHTKKYTKHKQLKSEVGYVLLFVMDNKSYNYLGWWDPPWPPPLEKTKGKPAPLEQPM